MDKPNIANSWRFAFCNSEIFNFVMNYLNINSFKELKAFVKLLFVYEHNSEFSLYFAFL